MFTVTVTDSGVIEAFNRLIAFGESPQPALMAIGEKMLEFTRERFASSTDPYGEPWKENTDTTLRRALHKQENLSGKIFSKRKGKEGTLNKPGLDYLAGKKPLIGESRSLSSEFGKQVPLVIGNDLVVISSTMVYAAPQQFGAKQGQFGRDKRNHPIPWGDIPARPFFPTEAGGLPDELSQGISDVLRIAIQNAKDGG
jgi:phage gpG-like protein